MRVVKCEAETTRRTRCSRLAKYASALSIGNVVLCRQHHNKLDEFGFIEVSGHRGGHAWRWPGERCECEGALV